MEIDVGNVRDMLDQLIGGHHRSMNKVARKKAEADPRAHRLSRLFPDGGARYRGYYAGKTKRGGHDVWYCWTTNRNVAGYFLCFRERRFRSGKRKDMGVRDEYAACKKRKAAKAKACARSEKFDGRAS